MEFVEEKNALLHNGRRRIGCSLDQTNHEDRERMRNSLKCEVVMETFLISSAKPTLSLNSQEKQKYNLSKWLKHPLTK